MIKDPNMLLSYINTKLRDNYKNIEDLCDDLDLDILEINKIFNNNNYYYDEKLNKYINK